MKKILARLPTTLVDLMRSRASLHLEKLALRQRLAMAANRDNKRHLFRPSEHIFWVWLILMSVASILSTDAQFDFSFGRTTRRIER